jgi:hypothetical protein
MRTVPVILKRTLRVLRNSDFIKVRGMREAVLASNNALNIAYTTVDDQHDNKRWRRWMHVLLSRTRFEVEVDEPAALWRVPAASPMILLGEWRCFARLAPRHVRMENDGSLDGRVSCPGRVSQQR